MASELGLGPAVADAYVRVTALTEQECRDVIAYLIGWTPLGVNLAISEVKAEQLDRQIEAGG